MKVDKDYLIGSEVIIERFCLPILGMISGYATPDLAMLRWISYIKSLNPEIRHIAGKNNVGRSKAEGHVGRQNRICRNIM